MNAHDQDINTYHIILTRKPEVYAKLVPIAEALDFADFIKENHPDIYREFTKVKSETTRDDTTKNDNVPSTELSK